MVKAAGHAADVKRLRVTEQQLDSFTPFYQVRMRIRVFSFISRLTENFSWLLRS
jgi:hypothetical protein